jgi:hypothetical protein
VTLKRGLLIAALGVVAIAASAFAGFMGLVMAANCFSKFGEKDCQIGMTFFPLPALVAIVSSWLVWRAQMHAKPAGLTCRSSSLLLSCS